jgi:transposase
MERRQFTDEFKREAVRLARQPGASKAGIAKDLGINANMLSRWAREPEGKPSKVVRSKSDSISNEEFERMRRELAKVKTERDILKKALGYFAADPSFRTALSHGTAMCGLRAQCAGSWGYLPAVFTIGLNVHRAYDSKPMQGCLGIFALASLLATGPMVHRASFATCRQRARLALSTGWLV